MQQDPAIGHFNQNNPHIIRSTYIKSLHHDTFRVVFGVTLPIFYAIQKENKIHIFEN